MAVNGWVCVECTAGVGLGIEDLERPEAGHSGHALSVGSLIMPKE